MSDFLKQILESGRVNEYGFYLPIFYSLRLDLMRTLIKKVAPDKPAPSRSSVVRALISPVLDLSDEDLWNLIQSSGGDIENISRIIRESIITCINNNSPEGNDVKNQEEKPKEEHKKPRGDDPFWYRVGEKTL